MEVALEAGGGGGLSDAELKLLHLNGLRTRREFFERCDTQIMSVLGCDAERVRTARQQVARGLVRSSTALAMLTSEEGCNIATRYGRLDAALQGGVKIGRLTEVVGRAGAGKTQLCLQISASCASEHAVIYLDTEGSFRANRLAQMARSAGLTRTAAEDEALLERVAVVRPKSCGELVALLEAGEVTKQAAQRGARLVVLDSVAALARTEFKHEEIRDRQALLLRLASLLKQLALQAKVAVVVTNQVMADFASDNSDAVVPALGGAWHHCVTTRLLLEKQNTQFSLTIAKSSSLPQLEVPYRLVATGLAEPEDEIAELDGANG